MAVFKLDNWYLTAVDFFIRVRSVTLKLIDSLINSQAISISVEALKQESEAHTSVTAPLGIKNWFRIRIDKGLTSVNRDGKILFGG